MKLLILLFIVSIESAIKYTDDGYLYCLEYPNNLTDSLIDKIDKIDKINNNDLNLFFVNFAPYPLYLIECIDYNNIIINDLANPLMIYDVQNITISAVNSNNMDGYCNYSFAHKKVNITWSRYYNDKYFKYCIYSNDYKMITDIYVTIDDYKLIIYYEIYDD